MEKDKDIKKLLELLEATTIPITNSRKNSGVGRSQVFGIIHRRYHSGYKEGRNNVKFPEIYKLLLKVGRKYCKIPFNAIQLNHNYEAKKHIDKNNEGNSCIFSIGNYKGGLLQIYEDGENSKPTNYDINYQPLIFNGANYYHKVTPIKSGNRYSFVFFNSGYSKFLN